jgi:aspartate/glutamate racemase
MTVLERLARAMWNAGHEATPMSDAAWAETWSGRRAEIGTRQIRAILTALREPGEEVIVAARNGANDAAEAVDEHCSQPMALAAIQSAIDAILDQPAKREEAHV